MKPRSATIPFLCSVAIRTQTTRMTAQSQRLLRARLYTAATTAPLRIRMRISRIRAQICSQLAHCLLSGSLATLSGCSWLTEPDPALRATLEISSATVRPTDSTLVTLTLTNVSRDTVFIEESCQRPNIEVSRADGRPTLIPEVIACISLLIVSPLAPGATRVDRGRWRDVTREGLYTNFRLPPGLYRARANVQHRAGTAVSKPVYVNVLQ